VSKATNNIVVADSEATNIVVADSEATNIVVADSEATNIVVADTEATNIVVASSLRSSWGHSATEKVLTRSSQQRAHERDE